LFACSACRALTPPLLLLLLLLLVPLLQKSGSSIATTDHLWDLRAQISLSTQSVDVRLFFYFYAQGHLFIDRSITQCVYLRRLDRHYKFHW